MRYEVQLYEIIERGTSPLISFLEDLPQEQSLQTMRPSWPRLDKLRDPHNHHEPLCEKLGDGLFQLRRFGRRLEGLGAVALPGGVPGVVVVHGVKLDGSQAVLARGCVQGGAGAPG